MEQKNKITYGFWAESNPEEKDKLIKEIKSKVKKKYPNNHMLVKNDTYCESILRVKLRKEGIIY